MKNFLTVFFSVSLGMSFGQYLHPTAGIQGEFVGACLVTDCGPSTYTDDGGSFNYSNDISGVYRVFCPNTAGNCMQITFNSFDVEDQFLGTVFDYLSVTNGSTQNSPYFTAPPSVALGGGIYGIFGTPAVPFSYTSTDASGCIGVRFWSDGSITRPGWSATLQCVPCAGGPNGTDNNDCISLTPLCSSASINANSSGPGIVAEGCTGSTCPAGGENHSNWFEFQAFSSGTIDVTITPTAGTDDYDYAIYGPNVTCGALGNPLRCSDAGAAGVTGTNGTSIDFSEDVTGDKFTQSITANAGDTYILVVDEWSPNAGSGYTLSFGGTASLDCNLLPVELVQFEAEYYPTENTVDISWITETERNSSHFIVERSFDGVNYNAIGQVQGAGNSNTETQYYAPDLAPNIGVNYYRLKSVDYDGTFDYSEIRTVNILSDEYNVLSAHPNPTSGLTEVVFNSYVNGESKVNIYNSQGKIVSSVTLNCKKGGNRFNIDLSDQINGIYFVQINTAHKTFSTKIQKK